MKAKITPFKVLFLSSWYPNKILPSNGNAAQRHAEAIRQSNDLVALHVCSGPFLKNKVYELDTFTKNNVFTIIAYYKKPSIKIFLLSELVWGYRYLRAGFMGFNIAKKRLGKIDVVHHNIIYPGGILALLLKYINDIPYIITEHWSGYLPANTKDYQGFFRRFITRKIARNASMITPVSNDLKNALKDYHRFNTRYKVIPNVADIRLFQNSIPHNTHGQEINRKKQMLHISTLDERFKNMTGMLRVVKEISKKRQDFEFHVICDGEAEPHIQFAKDLGLLDNFCFFHGPRSIEEISAAMKKADFFVLFSTSENFPCVLVESLAAGLPFIATRVGGIPELFSDSFGIMIESKDEKALFNAMNKMLDTHQNYDQEKMQKYAEENFSYEKVGRQYHEIYSDVLNNHN